jgi:hypothetical protein
MAYGPTVVPQGYRFNFPISTKSDTKREMVKVIVATEDKW